MDSNKFPPQGRDVRCAKCGHTWHEVPDGYVPPPRPEPEPIVVPSPSFEPEPERAPEPEPQPEVYVRPPVRDVEPQDESFESVAPTPRRRAQWKSPVLMAAGWAGLALIVLVLGVSAFHYRQHIVQTWPKTASLYAAVGLKVNASGLQIENYTYREETQDGQVVLLVSGAIRNVTDHDQAVPPVRVGLTDGDRRELFHWTFAPDVMTLRPGQSTRFVTKLASPPDRAREINLRFAKAGE